MATARNSGNIWVWRRTLVALACATFSIAVAYSALQSANAVASQREIQFPILAKVTGDRVNIRTGPSTNHRAFSKLVLNSSIVATGLRGDWVKIHLPQYEKCWIHGDFVRPAAAAPLVPGGEPVARLSVIGTSVNIRVSPNTHYQQIGQSKRGQIVIPTSRQSRDGIWIEIFAPSTAVAYIHKDFVKFGRFLNLQEIPQLLQRLRPGGLSTVVVAPKKSNGTSTVIGRDSGKPTRGTARSDAANLAKAAAAPALPRTVSEKLRDIHRRMLATLKKPAEQWSFRPLLNELDSIRKGSEDSGEARLAAVWFTHIREKFLPIVETMAENNAKLDLARLREKANKDKEKEIPGAIQPKPKEPPRFLAKGWVFTMGSDGQRASTHRLMKGNKLLYYLKSDTVKLDKLVFKRIGIQGRIVDLPAEAGARLIVVTGYQVLSH